MSIVVRLSAAATARRRLSSSIIGGVRSCSAVLSKATSSSLMQRSHVDSRSFLHQPNAVRISWLKQAIMEVLPVTSEVISSRGRSLDSLAIAVSHCPSMPPVFFEEDEDVDVRSSSTGTEIVQSTSPLSAKTTIAAPLGRKRIDDSWIEVIFPFSQHAGLKDSLMKAGVSQSLRYDKLFEVLDGLASDVALRHCAELRKNDPHFSIVTASVDEMHVTSPIRLQDDLKLQGYLTYVGKSSMEVTIKMTAIDAQGSGGVTCLGEVTFIMVARAQNKAANVYGLMLNDDAAKARFLEGQQRSHVRKLRAANSLAFKPPLPEEITMIHQLYLQSKQKMQQMAVTSSTAHGAVKSTPAASDVQEAPEQGHVLMKNTVFSNTQYMHLQNRNFLGKIFGGYIMRTAYEIAWVAASCYMGQENAEFVFVDDIQFVKSVNIGSIMEFSAVVAYQQGPYIVVKVSAEDVSPVNITRTRTNAMTYVFKSKNNNLLPNVLPTTYEEIVLYLEGKRSLDQLLALQ